MVENEPEEPRELVPIPIVDAPHQMRNCLTVVERIYHQLENQEPIMFDGRFSKQLEVNESCFVRPGAKAGSSWSAIDTGWVGENVGTIIIQNIAGKYLRTIPDTEEQRELDSKVIEVGVYSPLFTEQTYTSPFAYSFAEIPPKQHLRLNVPQNRTIYVRCLAGKVEYNLWAIPR